MAGPLALGLLLAGVTGNLVDRLLRSPGPFRGHVVDFLALPHWPVFNVADMCINLAAALFVLLLVRGVRLDGTREHATAGRASRTGPAGDAISDPGTDAGTDGGTDAAADPGPDPAPGDQTRRERR